MKREWLVDMAGVLLAQWAGWCWSEGGAPALAEAAFAASCLLVSFYYAGLFEGRGASGLRATLARLSLAVPFAVFLMESGSWLAGAHVRGATIALSAVATPVVIVALRLAVHGPSSGRERVLFLGASPLALSLAEEIGGPACRRYALVGVVDDDASAAAALAGVPYLGPVAALGRILQDTRPDRVVVTLTARRGRLPIHLLLRARLRGIRVEDGVDASERLWGKVAIESIPPSALVFSKEFKVSWAQSALGRGLSVFVAAAGLVLLAPLLGLVALGIFLESPGSPLFFQERIGLRGHRFRLVKFRTMRESPDSVSYWERDNAARITRLGRFLRRFRIDEMPQLFNVLRGDMNLVGPRPHPASNLDLFSKRIPYYAVRASVRPGITGWAQVRYGYANGLEEEIEKMRYDLYYIKGMSLTLDLRVLFETARVVLFGQDRSTTRRGTLVPFGGPRSGRRVVGAARGAADLHTVSLRPGA